MRVLFKNLMHILYKNNKATNILQQYIYIHNYVGFVSVCKYNNKQRKVR